MSFDLTIYYRFANLELRRIYSDLVIHYKFTNDLVASYGVIHFIMPQTHVQEDTILCFICHLFINLFLADLLFSLHASRIWNSLSYSCFYVKSLFGFKRKLYEINFSVFMKGRV